MLLCSKFETELVACLSLCILQTEINHQVLKEQLQHLHVLLNPSESIRCQDQMKMRVSIDILQFGVNRHFPFVELNQELYHRDVV